MTDRFTLYEACVQDPATLVPILIAIHGGAPVVLGEDFCGTAAVSSAWVRRGGRAVAVDQADEPLDHVTGMEGLRLVRGDVIDATSADGHAVDLLYVGNFSIGEWHRRADLVRYLAHARSRLRSNGVFVCDTYGGANACAETFSREHELEDGRRVEYAWEQREVDPITGSVVNAIHFRVRRGDVIELDLPDAFVYRWRLWSVPELRDALEDAGFTETAAYRKVPEAMDGDGNAYVRPLEAGELAEGLEDGSFDVLLAARDPITPRHRPRHSVRS